MEHLYKVIVTKKDAKGTEQKRLEAPKGASGYYRRDVSKDGMTITYRKVA